MSVVKCPKCGITIIAKYPVVVLKIHIQEFHTVREY